MDKIQILSTLDCFDSQYIKPKQVTFKQDGKIKTWDYCIKKNSVSILIYDSTSKSIVLVRQFRPAVYMTLCEEAKALNKTANPSNAITYELCAGLIDREDTPRNIAASEVLEETGYKVSADKLELITVHREVGASGTVGHVFYIEVTAEDKVAAGGGIEDEDEMIDLYYLPVDQIKTFMEDSSISNRPIGCLYALSWFLSNKLKN